jgi:hypothetical protein
MKGKLLLVIITVLFLGLGSANAQLPPKVVQVSGVVLISDSLYPAGFVAIYRAKDRRGTYSGRDGYFTLPVMVGDTLFFSCTGLKDSYFVIPADTKENQLSMVQVMNMESYMLPTAYILPYPSKTRLRAEILSLDLPGDDYVSFHREGNDIVNYDGMLDFSAQSYRSASSQLQNRYTNGFYSGGNLLSKDAWGKFMRSLKSGDLDSQQ